ncbi:hypothetical protein RvY_16778 [Ramazzottius varieornatus]|uniref:Uncharacterized protein n=1 Tax=Ramazzottius varieornatus TaxID=947166 RepID=A0A1D1W2B2_RAMVA|nr:hypothetical protein RvY_16778 [Ramazzottius varieornatus]
MGNSEHRNLILLRVLQTAAVLRIVLLCGICGVGVYCLLERIKCPDYDGYITTWNGVQRSLLAMVSATSLVVLSWAVLCAINKKYTKALYAMEVERSFSAPSSARTIRWLAMESISFFLCLVYGCLQYKLFGTAFVYVNITQDAVITTHSCATLDRQRMGSLPSSGLAWKPITVSSLIIVPFLSLFLSAVFYKRWQAARKMRKDYAGSERRRRAIQNLENALQSASEPQRPCSLHQISATEVWITIPIHNHSQNLPVQCHISQAQSPSATSIPNTMNFDAPPSYESVIKADQAAV